MQARFKVFVALIALTAVSVLDAAPAQAAKLHFGTQEYLRQIQDVEVKGPKGEALYLGHKYSFHSFILPYRMTDDGYVLGVRGEQSFFRLNDANIKSMQACWPAAVTFAGLSIVRPGLRDGAWRLDRACRHHRPDPAVDAFQAAAQARPAPL